MRNKDDMTRMAWPTKALIIAATSLSARRPGTPNVILIAATLVFFLKYSHSSFASQVKLVLSKERNPQQAEQGHTQIQQCV